jgi:hypothetical protein
MDEAYLDVDSDSMEEGLNNIFDGLVTPVLRDLRIHNLEYIRPIGWARLSSISFLPRPACAVHKLHLLDISLTDVQLVECLPMVSSLVELMIRCTSIRETTPNDIFLEQLIYQPPEFRLSPLLCPHLHAITFGGRLNLDGQILGNMIASRCRVQHVGGLGGVDDPTSEVARLKRVTLKFCEELDAGTKTHLENFKDDRPEIEHT